jgi:hypothetical protein
MRSFRAFETTKNKYSSVCMGSAQSTAAPSYPPIKADPNNTAPRNNVSAISARKSLASARILVSPIEIRAVLIRSHSCFAVAIRTFTLWRAIAGPSLDYALPLAGRTLNAFVLFAHIVPITTRNMTYAKNAVTISNAPPTTIRAVRTPKANVIAATSMKSPTPPYLWWPP